MIPFGPYMPDQSDYLGAHTTSISNVVPRADGYGPFPDFAVQTAALPAACRGYFVAINNDGSPAVFAATSNRIFKQNNTDFTWVPVSKVAALTSITNASPAVFTKAGHGLAAGDALVLSTSSALPTGLVVGTVYYVISAGLTADEFEVSTTPGGSAVNTTGAGAGTHSMTYFYTAAPTGDQWQFAQFNNFVFAVQVNSAVQVYDLTTSTAFADLAGSPPQARYIAIVSGFVVLSGMSSTSAYRVQWSGFEATTTWTAGTNQSDFQDFPDGGQVKGVAGGEYGIVVQANAFRRMHYVGPPAVFAFDRISDSVGILGPLSLVRAGDRIYFHSTNGFIGMAPTGQPTYIGKERVDRTFRADLDSGALQYFIGASDPRSSRVYWAYRSSSSSASLFDKIITYDPILDQWGGPLVISGEYLAPLVQPGVTLENLDSISSSLDALGVSLDDFSTAALPLLAAANSSHKIGTFSGSNLEATLKTPEQGVEGRRIFVRGFRPITDAGTVYGSIEHRATAQATAATTSETLINSSGQCPQRKDTRLAKAKVRIPSGTNWTYAKGVEPDFIATGQR